MREDELLARIAARTADLPRLFPAILVPPGDDCAMVGVDGTRLLLKVDQVILGVHADQRTPIPLLARKALARPLSDIAAMAGRPIASLCAAALPRDYPHADDLFDALDAAARAFGCPLVGGDIASTPGPLTLAVSVLGTPNARAIPRGGAAPGDAIYVTGSLGGSFDPATGLGHHLTFTPRLDEARHLADALGEGLHAMMDISDGLGIDAARLARASGCRVVLDAAAFPTRPGATWRDALVHGEDYELLLAAPSALDTLAVRALPHGTPLTRVGTVEPGVGPPWCLVRTPEGDLIPGDHLGFDHGVRNDRE